MTNATTAERQNLPNLAALLVSALFALVAPLQTFLIAYAVLGPFHYLTEIAWLRKKRFYCGKGWVQPGFYAAASAILCAFAVADLFVHRGWTAYAVAALLLLSMAALLRNLPILLAATAIVVGTRFFVHGYSIFLAAFVPTVLHVYGFTLLFLLSGLLRGGQRGVLRWLNPLLLLGLPVVLLWAPLSAVPAGLLWRQTETSFAPIHTYLASFFGIGLHFDAAQPLNPAAIAVFRVLAFLYLHHYLNWFAKSELLAWHKVSRPAWIAIGTLYTGMIALYAYSFTVGFYAAYFVSMLHVLLELPLDWLAGMALVQGIRRGVADRILRERPAVAAAEV